MSAKFEPSFAPACAAQQFNMPETGDIDAVIVNGPFSSTGSGEKPRRSRIFSCRPVADADINLLMAFYESGRRKGDFDSGIQQALEALLVSPEFLFCVERDPQGAAPGPVYRIERSRTCFAPLVLPVEQHSRRRGVEPRREGQAQR